MRVSRVSNLNMQRSGLSNAENKPIQRDPSFGLTPVSRLNTDNNFMLLLARRLAYGVVCLGLPCVAYSYSGHMEAGAGVAFVEAYLTYAAFFRARRGS